MDVHERITQLETEFASLKRHVMGDSRRAAPAVTGGDEGGPTSRRQMLKLAGAAAVGAAGASLATATPAGATTGNMQFGTFTIRGRDRCLARARYSARADGRAPWRLKV